MSSRRKIFWAILAAFSFGFGEQAAAQPVFENKTPTGFSPSDSLAQSNFVTDSEVTIRVDLNEAANPTHPVIANFQKLEKSEPFFETPSVAGYMSQAIQVDNDGVIHRAWIQQRGTIDLDNELSSPVYGVVYAKSLNGGVSFTDTVSVSGTLRFDMITTNVIGTGGFSTVDLVVNSRGNPRVVYAFDSSTDGAQVKSPRASILFNYSNDGGSSWLPANSAVPINDVVDADDDLTANKVEGKGVATGTAADDAGLVTGSRKSAFPRMALTSTDDIFIVYQRDLGRTRFETSTASGAGTIDNADLPYLPEGVSGGQHDIMLAKVAEDSLKGGSAQAVAIGEEGTAGFGGVRIALDTDADLNVQGGGTTTVTPDIAVGDDDVLHVVWFNPDDNQVRYKCLLADNWTDVTTTGWSQDVVGANVGAFSAAVANLGLDAIARTAGGTGVVDAGYGMSKANIAGNGAGAGVRVDRPITGLHLFPTVVVDRARTPDRVYVIWKHTDATAGAGTGWNDENIAYNTFDYNGSVGAGASWPTTPNFAFPQGGTCVNGDCTNGAGLFQNNTLYEIESFWGYTDRVAAVIDDRIPNSKGDLHIVFSGGGSATSTLAAINADAATAAGGALAERLYYARMDATSSEWELPQIVATARHHVDHTNTAREINDGGVLAQHRSVYSADLAMVSGDPNVYLSFVGGTPDGTAAGVGANRGGGYFNATASVGGDAILQGRGHSAMDRGDVAPLPYFKVIGRAISAEDISIPLGAFQYNLTYDPINPQETATNNLITVSVGDQETGAGIGWQQPGTSSAPGGFLTGQWRRFAETTLGVTLSQPGAAGAVFKGANSRSQAQDNVGAWEGKKDDSGSLAYAEWGDNDDKVGLLVRLNVLANDSAGNVLEIEDNDAATPTVGCPGACGGPSQNVSVEDIGAADWLDLVGSYVKDLDRSDGVADGEAASSSSAPMGSYFWMGANISIVETNDAPVVKILTPNESTTGSSNDKFEIKYTLFDDGSDFGTGNTDLKARLYYYPDNGLKSFTDIKTFATMIVDERDKSSVDSDGTDDFLEGTGATNVQIYTWDDPGQNLQQKGFAPITKALDGMYFIYIVASDGTNPPVFDVSSDVVVIRHIPIVTKLSPVATDTVDTGEFTNLAKANPYRITWDVEDFDDNAQIRLFTSLTSGLNADNVTVTGTFPSADLDLAGADPIELSDSLRSDEDTDFHFDVTAQGDSGDEIIAQNSYYIYIVVADDDSFTVKQSELPLTVRHSPAFQFTNPFVGEIDKINTTDQSKYTIEWQRGRSDQDLDGNALISLYYVGIDPSTKNFAGTDSTALIDSSAVLIAGNIREDLEGGGDQFIWDFRNPPSELPNTVRAATPAANHSAATVAANPHIYQVGEVDDTVWVYAVVHDSLGNTTVEVGGGVLLIGSNEQPASQVPKVTMLTPPSGGLDLTNGDVVRLEWDAFLIDDGTGTDDAYLRLYAAPAGKYSTITELEGHNIGDGTRNDGEQNDVIVINSPTGWDTKSNTDGTSTGERFDFDINLRESGNNFFLWDTKTSSFNISGTPISYDIFVAASMDPQFGDNVVVNIDGVGELIDSVASGIHPTRSPVLSKSPGTLNVSGTDPIFSLELSPGGATASTGDTLDLEVLVNSQGTGVNIISVHLDVPRDKFDLVDQDLATPGMQPFADSTGAFQAASTIAQNDTTVGSAEHWKINFVESILLPEPIGTITAPFDSSQVAATLQLVAKRYQGGAPVDSRVEWADESGRQSALYNGVDPAATSSRDAKIKMMPRARLSATVPLQGRFGSYADTVDVHLRQIGSLWDITDQDYIESNDVSPVIIGQEAVAEAEVPAAKAASVLASAQMLEDSVQVVTDTGGNFQLLEIPAGTYELTVKVKGYVSGRSATLELFDGLNKTGVDPTFGSDALGKLSPATALGYLRGGDATGDNQVDNADANAIFAHWNGAYGDSVYYRDADVNGDGVINALDLGFVSTNFGNDGFGAPPVFKNSRRAGDNSTTVVEVQGVAEVGSWWVGKVFEVTARATGMTDVGAFGFSLSYDPEKVKPLANGQAVAEGDVFRMNPEGSLFYQRTRSGLIDVTGGRIGQEWSASGDADLAIVRFVALTDDPGVIDIVSGHLVNSEMRGVAMQVKKAQVLPTIAALHQNFPNPFNPATEIRFAIPTARDVELRIYNQLGQTVATLVDQRMKAGTYNMTWNGTNGAGHKVSSGVYFYSLDAGEFSKIRKMTLIK